MKQQPVTYSRQPSAPGWHSLPSELVERVAGSLPFEALRALRGVDRACARASCAPAAMQAFLRRRTRLTPIPTPPKELCSLMLAQRTAYDKMRAGHRRVVYLPNSANDIAEANGGRLTVLRSSHWWRKYEPGVLKIVSDGDAELALQAQNLLHSCGPRLHARDPYVAFAQTQPGQRNARPKLALWNWSTDTVVQTPQPDRSVWGITFASHADRLLWRAESHDVMSVKIFDTRRQSIVRSYPLCAPEITAIKTAATFSPQVHLSASGTDIGGHLTLWDERAPRPTAQSKTRAQGITHLDFSPDGRTLLAAADNGMFAHDLRTHGNRRITPHSTKEAVFSPSGDFIAALEQVTRMEHRLRLYSASNPRRKPADLGLNPGYTFAKHLRFGADGTHLMAAGVCGVDFRFDKPQR